MIPREHGAWSILLLPFFSALCLARAWHWSIAPAGAAVLAAFFLREPLTVLARQRYVWKTPRPETGAARRWVLGLAGILAGSAGMLVWRWPLGWLLGFGAMAAVLTGVVVSMAVRNRQRSILMQVSTAAGLSSSCAAACHSAAGEVREWCWWLWALSALNAIGAIVVVHARLEARAAARSNSPLTLIQPARLAQVPLLIAAAICYWKSPWLTAALLLAPAVHLFDLWRLSRPAGPVNFHIVGLKAMTLSIVFSALLIKGLTPPR